MLAYLENSIWTRWTNQPRPLNGEGSYQLPRAAETIYSDAELAAYGLARVTPATVPAGQRMVSSSLTDQNGAPAEVLVLEDIPPVDYAALDLATLNDALAEPGSVVRALALVMLDEINLLRTKAGLAARTQQQLVTALQAKMR